MWFYEMLSFDIVLCIFIRSFRDCVSLKRRMWSRGLIHASSSALYLFYMSEKCFVCANVCSVSFPFICLFPSFSLLLFFLPSCIPLFLFLPPPQFFSFQISVHLSPIFRASIFSSFASDMDTPLKIMNILSRQQISCTVLQNQLNEPQKISQTLSDTHHFHWALPREHMAYKARANGGDDKCTKCQQLEHIVWCIRQLIARLHYQWYHDNLWECHDVYSLFAVVNTNNLSDYDGMKYDAEWLMESKSEEFVCKICDMNSTEKLKGFFIVGNVKVLWR